MENSFGAPFPKTRKISNACDVTLPKPTTISAIVRDQNVHPNQLNTDRYTKRFRKVEVYLQKFNVRQTDQDFNILEDAHTYAS